MSCEEVKVISKTGNVLKRNSDAEVSFDPEVLASTSARPRPTLYQNKLLRSH